MKIKEQGFKILPVRRKKTAEGIFHNSHCSVLHQERAEKGYTGRLNSISNSDIPRDLRLFFIFPGLKIGRISSKSQKQLSSSTFAAAQTTILRRGKLAGRGSQNKMNQDGEYKTG